MWALACVSLILSLSGDHQIIGQLARISLYIVLSCIIKASSVFIYFISGSVQHIISLHVFSRPYRLTLYHGSLLAYGGEMRLVLCGVHHGHLKYDYVT